MYVLGRQVGLDVYVIDLRVTLQPGQQRTLDLAQATPVAWTRGSFPNDPQSAFGGGITIAGQPMLWLSQQPDGAGYTVHLRRRTQPMICVDLWCTWYPDQPGWCHGEVAITASNPTIPDLTAVVQPNFALQFGNALTIPLGGLSTGLLPSGLTLADGQARILPLTFVWLQHLSTASQWSSMVASSRHAIGAVGITKLLADGNPIYPPGFSGRTWMQGNWERAVARLHTFDPPVCGPAPASSVTGRQEDQTFVRGEALLPDGVGAEWIAYFSALKLAARPCHHLEQDGRPLELAWHVNPRLVLWDGRVHWSPFVSPDRLGKFGVPSPDDFKFWWGPDVEHWLMNTLAAACRLTGSPACQWLLGHQARIYRLQLTTIPGLSTSNAFAARSVGWEGILAVHLWRELEDRTMAAAVRTHWQTRVTNIIVPANANRPQGIWDPRLDDLRMGKGWWYSPWQQAVGAYGLELGCTILGPAFGREVARDAAATVLRNSFVFENGVWRNFAAVALDGRHLDDPIFYLFGTPMAAAVVLRHDPNHPLARSIYNQMKADATGVEHFSWFAPGVR